MKNYILSFLLFCILIPLQGFSQDKTIRDTINNNELIISMDAEVEDLLKKEENDCLGASFTSNDRSSVTPTKNSSSNSSSGGERTRTGSRPLSTAEICARSPKLSGYKILLTTVKSNNEANEVKAYFRRRFPSIKTITDASLRPNYKVLAGSYFTKQSAAKDLSMIRAYFKSAIAVPYTIYCAEAK